MSNGIPSVFAYTSPQQYLRDWFEWNKANRKGVSLQSLSQKLGLTSRSHLHRLLHAAEFPISSKLVARLGVVLQHDTRQQEYFEALVSFARAETLEEKNLAYNRMHRLLSLREKHTLQAERFAYFSTWYLPTLRELATMRSPCPAPKELARQVLPPITESQARKGLELLLELSMLEDDGQGGYRQTENMVDTGDDLRDLALQNFQCETAKLAATAIASLPASEREATTLTFGIPAAGFVEIRKLIRRLRDEMIRTVLDQEGAAEQVYHLNIHCYPTSRSTK